MRFDLLLDEGRRSARELGQVIALVGAIGIVLVLAAIALVVSE